MSSSSRRFTSTLRGAALQVDAIRMDIALARTIVEALARRVIAHTDELTQLDQAIGDGDHGLNMKRGFEAVLADLDALAASDAGTLFTGVGRTLVMKVGGASGPLYGTLFMQLGKSWPAVFNAAGLHACCKAAVEAVAARGKSQSGQKTMLDVLIPVVAGLEGDPDIAALRANAAARAQATIQWKRSERASFLKERSTGTWTPAPAPVN
jgi:dihydroxyacetone kinase-like protein